MKSAHELIDPIFLNTPTAHYQRLDDVLGCVLHAKVETLNPIRCFKGRGTELFASIELSPHDIAVCASAGNFGQGMARAAALRGNKCVVFVSTRANQRKVQAMRSLGAEVVLTGNHFDAAKLAARQFAKDEKARFVEDGAEPAVAEGAGTIGLELASAVPDLDTIFVPLGNGALLAGVGAAFRFLSPKTRIVGVVAENAPSMKLSLEQERSVETDHADTIADGVAVRVPVPASLLMLAGRFNEVVTVAEADIFKAMGLVLEHLGLAIEPAGVLGVAAAIASPASVRGKKVGTILCGSNLADDMLTRLLR